MLVSALKEANLEEFVHAAPTCLHAMRLNPSEAEPVLRKIGMRKGHVRTFMTFVWQKVAASFLQGTNDRFHVSWNQSQLLTVHLVDGATSAYNMAMAFHVQGPLSVSALRESLGTVVERHAVLRTTYELDADGDFSQLVHASIASDASVASDATLQVMQVCK